MMIAAAKSSRRTPKAAAATSQFDAETLKAIESSKNGLASQKGMPWSETEYNMSLAFAVDSISAQYGEAAGQELRRQMASVPIRGGRFNPWSGD